MIKYRSMMKNRELTKYVVVNRGGARPWHVTSLLLGYYASYKTQAAAHAVAARLNGEAT